MSPRPRTIPPAQRPVSAAALHREAMHHATVMVQASAALLGTLTALGRHLEPADDGADSDGFTPHNNAPTPGDSHGD